MKNETTRLATQGQVKDLVTTLGQSLDLRRPLTFEQAQRIQQDKGNFMLKIQSLINCYATPAKSIDDIYYLNCDIDPDCQKGESVDKKLSRKYGILELVPSRIRALRPKEQRDGVSGYQILKSLRDQPVLPSHVYDFFMKNEELIPEEFKERPVCFWGTIFVDKKRHRFVNYIYWTGDEWNGGSCDLAWKDWETREEAAIMVPA